jgi:hypothetical protein
MFYDAVYSSAIAIAGAILFLFVDRLVAQPRRRSPAEVFGVVRIECDNHAKNARIRSFAVLAVTQKHAVFYYLTVGGAEANKRPYVRPHNYRHNGVHRRHYDRRIHRAAQRPIKPASRNVGLQYNHAMLGDGPIEEIRRPTMFVAIGVLLIVVGAIALGAIYKLIDSFVLATVLQLVLLAAAVAIFMSLR